MNYSEITTATESTATVQPEDYHAAAHATAAELVKIFDRYITAHPDVPFEDLTAAVESEVKQQLRL